jgi:hypothetical protein
MGAKAHIDYTTRKARGGVSGAVPTASAWMAESEVGTLQGNNLAAHYITACERAGIDPSQRPFLVVRVGVRDVLCATHKAVKLMNIIHGITHEMVEGPCAVDLCGVQLVKVVCRAKARDGRVETATATVLWGQPQNSLEGCMARARGRATLSLLGLAVLDEHELEMIPSALRQTGELVDLEDVKHPRKNIAKRVTTRRVMATQR